MAEVFRHIFPIGWFREYVSRLYLLVQIWVPEASTEIKESKRISKIVELHDCGVGQLRTARYIQVGQLTSINKCCNIVTQPVFYTARGDNGLFITLVPKVL